jgi:exopolysaccharide biosynthesis polyprenyl glycosylphosphotransferase
MRCSGFGFRTAFRTPSTEIRIPNTEPLAKIPFPTYAHPRMYQATLHFKRFLLLFGDFLMLQGALALTLVLRYGRLDVQTWRMHELPFLIISLLWAVGLFVTGLYDLSRARNTLSYFRTFLEGMFVNLLIAFAFFYLFPVFGIAPRTNLLLFFAASLLLVYCWRLLFNKFIMRGLFRTRLMYVGPADDAAALRGLVSASTYGFELVSVVHTTPRLAHEADGMRWTDRLDALSLLVKQDRIGAVVLGHGIEEYPALREALYGALYTSVGIIDRKGLEETLTGRVPVASVDKAWFLRNLRENEKAWFETVKRVLDIVTAIPFALLTIAVTPVVAVLMKATSSGSVFFTQERIGKHGKPFRMVKFRTMRHPKGQTSAETGGAQFAAANDPRVTRIGRFLRKTRIDELPQIWNVLKGDMSFVGPRPERPEFVEQLTERMPYYALRHLTRPGLTGWAQVSYTYASTLDDNLIKLQYDLYYVKHRSLVLDAAILLKTINTVLRRQGT